MKERLEDYLKGICTKSLCDYWHRPECQFRKSEPDANSVISARLHTGRMKVNPAKKTKKDGDKSSAATVKDTVGLCVAGRAAGICGDFSEGHESFGTNSTSTIHKSCAALKVLISSVPTL